MERRSWFFSIPTAKDLAAPAARVMSVLLISSLRGLLVFQLLLPPTQLQHVYSEIYDASISRVCKGDRSHQGCSLTRLESFRGTFADRSERYRWILDWGVGCFTSKRVYWFFQRGRSAAIVPRVDSYHFRFYSFPWYASGTFTCFGSESQHFPFDIRLLSRSPRRRSGSGVSLASGTPATLSRSLRSDLVDTTVRYFQSGPRWSKDTISLSHSTKQDSRTAMFTVSLIPVSDYSLSCNTCNRIRNLYYAVSPCSDILIDFLTFKLLRRVAP